MLAEGHRLVDVEQGQVELLVGDVPIAVVLWGPLRYDVHSVDFTQRGGEGEQKLLQLWGHADKQNRVAHKFGFNLLLSLI